MRWRRKKPYLCTSVLSPTFKSRSVLGVSSGADFFCQSSQNFTLILRKTSIKRYIILILNEINGK